MNITRTTWEGKLSPRRWYLPQIINSLKPYCGNGSPFINRFDCKTVLWAHYKNDCKSRKKGLISLDQFLTSGRTRHVTRASVFLINFSPEYPEHENRWLKTRIMPTYTYSLSPSPTRLKTWHFGELTFKMTCEFIERKKKKRKTTTIQTKPFLVFLSQLIGITINVFVYLTPRRQKVQWLSEFYIL